MTNKLVVIINSLKVTKIKKILLYEMKFLVPNYSCLQNPWIGSYCPQIPVLSVLNWICWTPPNKIPGYATAEDDHLRVETYWIDVLVNKVVTQSYTSAFVVICLISFDTKLESVFGVMNRLHGQACSWEDDSVSATQRITSLFLNPKVSNIIHSIPNHWFQSVKYIQSTATENILV